MRRLLLACLMALGVAPAANAGLRPDEIAILAVRTSKQSRELAEYYSQARGIPKTHICLLEIAPAETISRADWEGRVRPAIRRWLASNQLEAKIRCFVPVWDVPLKIGPIEPAHPAVAETIQNLENQKRIRRGQLERLAGEIDKILPADEPPRRTLPPEDAGQKEYADFLEAALKDSQARLRDAQERKDAAFQPAALQLERLYVVGGGGTVMVRSLQTKVQNDARAPLDILRKFELTRGELAGLRAGVQSLLALRESAARDQQLLALVQQSDGILGALNWIDQSRELWRKNETHSSFDSELALLHFPPYALLRWQGNALFHQVSALARETLPPTLMVSRIEAPTFELSKQLIDSAIEIEKSGLTGKVYIDARGMAADKNPGTYGDYDQSLRDLAQLLKEHTTLDVVLDDKGDLFQPGDCPDAALYCGWYSLAKYVDAFQWKRGAVGYHLASSEAVTLRQSGSTVWCKRMLESGVCATLGPTYEPYLAAFPRPLDFFPLLLTGEYTLAEAYARTNPYHSWVMVLVGDPLYNPFRANPPFGPNNRPEAVERLMRDKP